MKVAVRILVWVMLFISSGALIQQIKDGGAREQGLVVSNAPSLWDALPRVWGGAAILLYLLLVLSSRKKSAFKHDALWLLLLGWCIASTLWAAYPVDALRASLLIVGAYLVVLMHTRYVGADRAVSEVAWFAAAVLVISIAFVVVLPGYGISVGDHAGSWQGAFDHKNGLGNFAGVALVLGLVVLSYEKTWKAVALCVLALVLVVGSRSTTGLIIAAAAVVFYVLQVAKPIRSLVLRLRLFIVLLAVLVLAALVAEAIAMEAGAGASIVASMIGEDGSYTGRALIWYLAWQDILDSPWVGYGLAQYSAISLAADGGELKRALGFIAASTHNGFLEAAYALGGVGVLAVVLLLCKFLLLPLSLSLRLLSFLYVLALLLLNFSESRLIGLNFFLVAFMYLYRLAYQDREVRCLGSAQ